MPLPLSEIFPHEKYRFHLTLRRGNLADFFRPQNPGLLTSRQFWIQEDRERYVFADDSGSNLISGFERWLCESRILEGTPVSAPGSYSRLARLGELLEPDFVLLSRTPDGATRVTAGAVCFPSGWAPAEKLGLSLDRIHGVVPGLNPSIGSSISHFLQRLKAGVAYERANWGIAATAELNLHPDLSRPRLGGPLDPASVWVRIEDQVLGALPPESGIVFGIRLRIIPLAELLKDEGLRRGFECAVATMPEDLALYKGIDALRPELLRIARG